jgi:predicted anti-sigma-YlaC factor YlaD
MNPVCHGIQMRIADCFDGGVDESTRARVIEHSRSCGRCSAMLAFHAELQAVLEEVTPPAPEVYYEGVLAEVHRRLPAAAPRLRRLHRPRDRRRTAMLAMVAMLGFWAWVGPLSGLWRGIGERISAATPAASASPAAFSAPPLVASAAVGLVSSDSTLLELSAEQRREMGLACLERRTRLPASERRVLGALGVG